MDFLSKNEKLTQAGQTRRHDLVERFLLSSRRPDGEPGEIFLHQEIRDGTGYKA